MSVTNELVIIAEQIRKIGKAIPHHAVTDSKEQGQELEMYADRIRELVGDIPVAPNPRVEPPAAPDVTASTATTTEVSTDATETASS